ncbi:MAG: transcriptional regulator [Actinomycetota bacterium]|nr:transcriptional regulator [Actinomycetota bacterium]
MVELSDTKRRIVDRLKRVESATATDLAAEFGLTDTALRQHLDALEDVGMVTRSKTEPAGRGRPPVHWQLASAAAEVFPDRHGELTVELITSLRTTLGERALDRVMTARADRQTTAYAQSLVGITDLGDRVRRLADLRSDEGYLAESAADGEAFILIEHHCPIREAAAACGGLCSAELDVFQRALGSAVTVTRTQHVLSGDRRCAYRVEPAAH